MAPPHRATLVVVDAMYFVVYWMPSSKRDGGWRLKPLVKLDLDWIISPSAIASVKINFWRKFRIYQS